MSTPAEDAIRAEIARRGPIPFADFMALALGHAEGGYYTAAAARPTRGGDFLTAPELHPVFGAALARQVAEAWERLGRPAPFTLIEYGAGAGTLALAILAGLRDDGSPLAGALVHAPVELNRHRLGELRTRAAAAGLPVVDPAGLDTAPTAGAVLANEFLDALPVHLLEVRDGRALRGPRDPRGRWIVRRDAGRAGGPRAARSAGEPGRGRGSPSSRASGSKSGRPWRRGRGR